MNQIESIASLWLEPQIGFQLAHEQFKVPELVELGIAADEAGFDLLAVSDHSSIDNGQWTKGNASLRAICGRTYYRSRDLEGGDY